MMRNWPLADTVPDPIKTHVDGFGTLFLHGVVSKAIPEAVLLSVWIGVGIVCVANLTQTPM
jgi:hypothetical protein